LPVFRHGVLLFTLLFAPVGPAGAQTVITPAANPEKPGTSPAATAQLPGPIEEIIVTARRREESLQQVPVSMAALTGETLRQRQVQSTEQLAAVVPNLEFDSAAPASGSSSVGQVFIRGIGQSDFTPVTDPGVAVYLDDVYLARSPGNILDLIALERIEVLRGPQGTLFGRNAIGGAIKIHTRQPSGTSREVQFEGRVGSDALRFLSAYGNQPLGGDFAVNAVAYRETQDGYVTRISDGIETGDRDRWGVRATLAGSWNALDISLVADLTRIDENGAPTVSGGVNDRQGFANFGNAALESCSAVRINPAFDASPGSGPPSFPPPGVPVIGAPGCFDRNSVPGPYLSGATYPVVSRLDNGGLALRLSWTASNTIELRSTTGYRQMTLFSSRDGDNTPANIFATRDDYDHRQLSQELQVHYDSGKRLRGLAGLFLFREDGFNRVDVTVPGGALRSGGDYENRSWAAFTHGAWDFTGRFTLSLGLRHTEDRKSTTPDQFVQGDASMGGVPGFFDPTWPLLAGQYLGPTGPLPAGTRLLNPVKNNARFDQTDVTVDLSYRASERLTAYLSFSTGYKSGGFDQRFTAPTPDLRPSRFDPETVDSLELGLKGTSRDGRLRWNLALFDASYEDLQIIVRESFNPLTVNAGSARVRGGELEAEALLGDTWTVNLGLGHLDSGYRRLSQAAQDSGVALDNVLPNAPEWSANLAAAWRLDLTNGGSLTPRLEWSWQDLQYFDAVNSEQIRQPDYHLVHLSLAWLAPSTRWEVTAALRNALDERYLITGNSAFDTAAAYVERVFARPREWQLSARYRF